MIARSSSASPWNSKGRPEVLPSSTARGALRFPVRIIVTEEFDGGAVDVLCPLPAQGQECGDSHLLSGVRSLAWDEWGCLLGHLLSGRERAGATRAPGL
jgi:hypothetical protein